VRIFQVTLKSTKDLGICKLHGEAKENILKNSEVVGVITNETFSLLTATSWIVARDYA